jgi:replicative DNA helicase
VYRRSNLPDIPYTSQVLSWRGLTASSFSAYGVHFKVDSFGKPHSVVFPYVSSTGEAATKERKYDSKEFWSTGAMHESSLFGMDKFSAGSAKAITVTEGELDAISVYQMLGSKYPSVSVRGASSARRDCERARDYLNSFDRIYICFDNDEPGQKAVKEVSQLFDVNKVVHVQLTKYKDANEYLQQGAEKEWVSVWWNSKPYMPKGIINDYSAIEEILLTESEQAVAHFPFPTLDAMTYGIRLGEVLLFTAQEKVGKQISLATLLPTPTGWTAVKNLKVGDKLFAADGSVTEVTFITEPHTRPYFDVVMSDGTKIEASDNHRWTVRDLQNRVDVKTTQEMFDTEGGIIAKGSKAKFVVPQHPGVELPEADLEIDPFLLGVWLADGNSWSDNVCLSKSKLERCSGYELVKCRPLTGDRYDVRLEGLHHSVLKGLGLYRNKHIPSIYIRSSYEQREQLFKGLLFDGWSANGKNGKQENEFYSSNKKLFDQTVELARSLGYIVSCRSRQGRYKKDGIWVNCKTAYSFRYRTSKWKAIREIKPIGNMEGRCLTVDHPSHLFAAGEGWTLTHNTEVMRAMQYHLLKTTDDNIGIIHLEEEEKRSVQGLVGYELGVAAHLPDSGLSVEDQLKAYKSLTKKDGRVHFYSHFGSDDPNTILDIIRYLATACSCKYIFLDHITMLVTGFEGDDERKKLDYLSTKLAMLTRELDFTLFLVSHVNDDGKTRGSRNIAKVADLIVSLNRDVEAATIEERNRTYLTVKGSRYAGLSGPAGVLVFDQKSFTLKEMTFDEHTNTEPFDPGF